MAILNLDDWAVIIQANPILDAQQCNDLRESVHAGVFDDTKMIKVFQYSGSVDFVNSHSDLWRIWKNFVKNYLFDDNPTPEEEDDPNYIYDVITKNKGDFLEREIDKITNFPVQLRNEMLIEVGEQMGGNLSTKLQTQIDLLNV
jgi:hypothetical protein